MLRNGALTLHRRNTGSAGKKIAAAVSYLAWAGLLVLANETDSSVLSLLIWAVCIAVGWKRTRFIQSRMFVCIPFVGVQIYAALKMCASLPVGFVLAPWELVNLLFPQT